MFMRGPFLGQVPLRPPAMGCGGWITPPPEEEVRTTPMRMGCDEHPYYIAACSKCRKKKKRDWTLVEQEPASEMISRRGTQSVLLGDARHPHYMGQICPTPGGSADPANFGPDVACQATASGDIICSNNVIYSGSCPHAPKANVPGVAPNMPGTNIPQAPPPLSAAGVSTPAAPAAAPGAAPAAAPASTPLPIVGIAAGGLAVAGLAYVLFVR